MTASQRRKALKRLLRAAIYCPNHALPFYDRPNKPSYASRHAVIRAWFGRVLGNDHLGRWSFISDR